MKKIQQIVAGFKCMTESINTTSPGRLMMQMVGDFAEFEREMLWERTSNGLDLARKQGRIGGRRPKLKENQKEEIVQLLTSGRKSATDAARLFNVHSSTICRLLQERKRET